MIPAIVLRPQPGCDATVAAARAIGLEARGFPLFEITTRTWDPPAPDTFDALLLGSANALRHAGAAIAAYRGKPAYAVGQHTAAMARAAGFEVVATGAGGLQALLAELRPADRRLLRLAGETRIALTPPSGTGIAERVVYASEPLAMPPELVALLADPAVVLLHSAEAARHFAQECARCAIVRAHVSLVALGPRIAEAAGCGWRAVAAVARPDEAALLALTRKVCEKAAT